MEFRDLLITPVFLVLIFVIAWIARGFLTDQNTRVYFIPALSLKIAGALAVGLIYQFYYGGGDTLNFHTHGSRHIWEALIEEPSTGLKLLFDNGYDDYSSYKYASKIWYYGDRASYSIVKLAAIFDLLTISTYSATASLFAVLSFSGIWVLFITFYRLYPDYVKHFAWAILFVPSVIFWGSGIFKDTITLAAVGWGVFSFYKIMFEKGRLLHTILLLISFYIIYMIKIYILLTFIPALIVWFIFRFIKKIRSQMLRILIFPFTIIVASLIAFQAINFVAQDNSRYKLENLANTAKITAYDIRYGWGARDGVGSGYDLGELDGSLGSMILLAPQAVNVTLFRPYLFEVSNPLMLMASLESTLFLLLTLYIIYWMFKNLNFKILLNSEVVFCLVFAIVFAFAVGISSYNFGTLSRYKLPLIPFYLSALVIIYNSLKSDKKLEELESVE